MGTTSINSGVAAVLSKKSDTFAEPLPFQKRINFVVKGNRKTPNPEGWDEYDGSIYDSERGYGWLVDLTGNGRDREARSIVQLANGTTTSLEDLGRLELANMQGTHGENQPLVFRIDLPDGWYRVTCTSVNPGGPLPLVDQRSFKCRAHDVVFAGANHGAPLVVKGNQLVEGTGVVEVTDGHLRIVIGDTAYGGWTWEYRGPWYAGWKQWFGKGHLYANSWYKKLTRRVDPGFHALRLNSLTIEAAPTATVQPVLVFRDFFNRDNSSDVNSDVSETHKWIRSRLHPEISGDIDVDLYQTSMRLVSHKRHENVIGLTQEKLSPGKGIIRYSTRVSLFMGEGSHRNSGSQEGGILMLGEPAGATEFNSTFVGVRINGQGPAAKGWLVYKTGDGKDGYRTNLEVPDTMLPFKITEGEFEIIIEHDVSGNIVKQINVNGFDVTNQFTKIDLSQRIGQGLFGIRGAMHNHNAKVKLQQFYWYYRVEIL